MAADIGLLEVRILIFRLLYLTYFMSDFDGVCGRINGLIRTCVSKSSAFKVAVPFNQFIYSYYDPSPSIQDCSLSSASVVYEHILQKLCTQIRLQTVLASMIKVCI